MSRRSYRHRNPKVEEQKQPDAFFTHANPGTAKAKKTNKFFQSKLTVGAPGDKYEQEADAAANNVANNSAASETSLQRMKIGRIQRLSSDMEDEKLGTNDQRMRRDKDIQAKPETQKMEVDENTDEKKLQTKSQQDEKDELKETSTAQTKLQSGGQNVASPTLSSRITGSAGQGKPLAAKTLTEMHSSFGVDFSSVNVHTDANAAEMNTELGAQAFTHQNDVYFGTGKFDPDKTEGKKLLAHELTHVVQQGGVENEIK